MNKNDYENIIYENREDAKAEGYLLLAKKMLEDGIDAERVCKISGLTIEEIMEVAS